jgi:hypothetical protein
LAFEPAFAPLLALLLSVMSNSERSFYAFTWIYRSLKLDDYFGDRRGLYDDIQSTWFQLRAHFPKVASAFERFDRQDRFAQLAEEWLTSVMTLCYSPKSDARTALLSLLHHILTARRHEDDPRFWLRVSVVCALGVHESSFSQVQDETGFEILVSQLRLRASVEHNMLELVRNLCPPAQTDCDRSCFVAACSIHAVAVCSVGVQAVYRYIEAFPAIADMGSVGDFFQTAMVIFG